jgi:hypothetical protein
LIDFKPPVALLRYGKCIFLYMSNFEQRIALWGAHTRSITIGSRLTPGG